MDWLTIHKQMSIKLKDFVITQEDVDKYAAGLQLKSEAQGANFKDTVPAGLIATLGVRLSYSAIDKVKANHFHFLGLVVRSFGYECVTPVKIGQKVNIDAGALPPVHVKRGLDITAEASITDAETGKLLCKFRVTFLKMVKHGKKIEGSGSKKIEFEEENVILSEEWKTDTKLPNRWLDISGDPNPIHMHPILGKMFGLPSNIVHGTWIFAKAMIHFEDEFLEGESEVEMKFISPLIVGKTGTLKTYKSEEQGVTQLCVWSQKRGKPAIGSFGSIRKKLF